MDNINNIIEIETLGAIISELSSNNTNYNIFKNYIQMITILVISNLDDIKKFFENNPNLLIFINCCYKRKIYPIHYIFSNTNLSIEMIDYFVLNNCKLYYENEDELIIKRLLNNTGLTKKKVIDILYYLKDHNYNFSKKDEKKENIFHYLTKSIHINKTIFDFFNKNCGKKDDLNVNMVTPLLMSTYNNNTMISLFLIESGCDINKINHNNNTPLMYACMHNNSDVIFQLLEKGADLNYSDNQQDIPFFYSCGCDNKGIPDINIVKFLYLKGAEIHKTSYENLSPLHYAAGCLSKIVSIPVIMYLISIGVNTDILDVHSKTFLDYLIEYEPNINVVKELINQIKLTIPLKNSLIINKLIIDNIIKIKKIKLEESKKCNITHSNFESGDTFYVCEHNHSFDSEYLLEWYNESKKYVCPLCFKIIDLSCVYLVI